MIINSSLALRGKEELSKVNKYKYKMFVTVAHGLGTIYDVYKSEFDEW